MQSSEELQYAIVSAVYARGYDAGDAPRQLVKMLEEIAELSEAFDVEAPRLEKQAGCLYCNVGAMGEEARELFDSKEDCGFVRDANAAIHELKDMMVTVCCLAHALGVDDILAEAATKAAQDLKRGRRGENEHS